MTGGVLVFRKLFYFAVRSFSLLQAFYFAAKKFQLAVRNFSLPQVVLLCSERVSDCSEEFQFAARRFNL